MRKYNESNFESKIFTHNIIWLRQQHHLSKKKMAELLEISLYSLNKLEKGEIPPRLSVAIIFTVQKRFGIHPSKQFSCWLEN